MFQIGIDIGFDKGYEKSSSEQPMISAVQKGEIIWPDIPFTMDTLIAQNPHINKEVLRKELEMALKNNNVFIRGMMIAMGGVNKGKPVLIFMKKK